MFSLIFWLCSLEPEKPSKWLLSGAELHTAACLRNMKDQVLTVVPLAVCDLRAHLPSSLGSRMGICHLSCLFWTPKDLNGTEDETSLGGSGCGRQTMKGRREKSLEISPFKATRKSLGTEEDRPWLFQGKQDWRNWSEVDALINLLSLSYLFWQQLLLGELYWVKILILFITSWTGK